MTKIEIHASQNQDAGLESQTSEDNRRFMPEQRSTKVVWKVLYIILCATAVFLYGFYGENIQTKIEFYCLGLLGILVTPIIQCFCDVIEEFRQYGSRYHRDSSKLVKDCFSAVPWKILIFVAVLNVALLVSIRGKRNIAIITLDDLMYILSGLVFGPLVTYLLNLNALSNVGLSRLIEKLGWHPLQTLALDYFLNHIKRRTRMFSERFICSNIPVQDQSDAIERPDRDKHTKIRVNSEKMVLLVSHTFENEITLVNLDNHISEVYSDISDGGCPELPVYRLQHNGKEHTHVIVCVKEPLETIKTICDSKAYKFLYGDNPKDHIDSFCNELSKILARPGHEFYRDKCIVVSSTKVTNGQRGWLVKVIMKHIEADEAPPTTIVNIGRQPQETIDNKGQNSTTSSNDVKEKQCNSQDYFNPSENSDENSPLLNTATNENILKRDKDPLNPKLKLTKNRRTTKSKSNTHQSSTRLVPDPPSNSSNKYVRMQSTTSVLWEKQELEDGKISFNSTDSNVRYKKEDDLISADDLGETSTLSGEELPNIFEGRKAPLVLPFPKSETNEQHVPDELDKGFNQLKSDLPEEPENAKPLLLPPSYFVAGEVKYKEKCGANDDAPVSDRAVQAKSQATCGGHEIDAKENCLKEDNDIKHMHGL